MKRPVGRPYLIEFEDAERQAKYENLRRGGMKKVEALKETVKDVVSDISDGA